eukprot:TRINITY_DN19618_c0_g1_i1.p1 TRINITY_DN19618_c0_g1~~TRINITY_DN19618_c0_g1_i1.p1  ORF type:complete len:109 (+),score=16.06 TRINITY_DN19618_c0_g1_i1:260-586(+)
MVSEAEATRKRIDVTPEECLMLGKVSLRRMPEPFVGLKRDSQSLSAVGTRPGSEIAGINQHGLCEAGLQAVDLHTQMVHPEFQRFSVLSKPNAPLSHRVLPRSHFFTR